MGKKVIVAGHVCLDITPAFPETGKRMISEILKPGKLIETKGVSVSAGGAVANTGLAMKFFGADSIQLRQGEFHKLHLSPGCQRSLCNNTP